MEPCAAGLRRVRDRPRNTKSEVPPRLPVTIVAESACAGIVARAINRMDPRGSFTSGILSGQSSARRESTTKGCDCDPVDLRRALTSCLRDPMQFSLGKFADRWARISIALCVLYSVACALALAMGWGGEATAAYIGAWGTMPIEAAVALMLWPVVTDAELSSRRRLAFRLFFGALLLDLIASVGWGYSALTENVTFGSWPDVLYLFYYPVSYTHLRAHETPE